MKAGLGKIVLTAGLAVILMTGCATTEDKKAQADRDELCAVLDTNHDGRITREEFMAQTNDKAKGLEVYEKCDPGNKGYMTYDEFWAHRTMLPPELIITTPPVLRPAR